jgi:hypothetical protein
MQIKALALVIGLAACGKGSQCKEAVQHMVDLASAEGNKRANPETMKQFETFGTALTAACEKDKWSKEATDCMKSAADFKAQHECEGKLTPEQQKGSEAAVDEAMKSSRHDRHKDKDKSKGLEGITDQRDRMCACTDAACAEAVNKERDSLVKPDDNFMQFNDLDDERTKCLHKLTGK